MLQHFSAFFHFFEDLGRIWINERFFVCFLASKWFSILFFKFKFLKLHKKCWWIRQGKASIVLFHPISWRQFYKITWHSSNGTFLGKYSNVKAILYSLLLQWFYISLTLPYLTTKLLKFFIEHVTHFFYSINRALLFFSFLYILINQFFLNFPPAHRGTTFPSPWKVKICIFSSFYATVCVKDCGLPSQIIDTIIFCMFSWLAMGWLDSSPIEN